MKRIIFWLDSRPRFFDRALFICKGRINGVSVKYRRSLLNITDINGTLYVVDTPGKYEMLASEGVEALVSINEGSDADLFPGAKYFIMDAEEAGFEYFDKVFKRIHNIPWEAVTTDRLILRETTEADVDFFYEMYKDPRMTQYTENTYYDKEEERNYVREYRDKVYYLQGFGVWTVVRKSDGRVIGRAGLTAREGFDGYEVGFAVGTEFWGNGYASEAVKGVIGFAADNKLGCVYALVMTENTASKRVLLKNGFKYSEDTVLSGVCYEVFRCMDR